MITLIDKKFWKGKNVLITGHTGFKGSWLSIFLIELGARVIGYSLDPYTDKDNFVLSKLNHKMIDIRGDILDNNKLEGTFRNYKPEIVFHLAAQPLVRVSYKKPKQTYETNVIGTLNVLECIKNNDYTKAGVLVTTDKCYENKEQIWGYRESDRLGGYDPYSSSKACAELLIASYRNSFMNPKNYQVHGKSIASVRAGNVIGGGDWSTDRIIPDCIKSIESNKPIKLRNPNSVRPWQHVLEPLSGYTLLAQKMFDNGVMYGGSWNFGPNLDSLITVYNLVEILVNKYGSGIIENLQNSNQLYEAGLLLLDSTKSNIILGWKPKIDISDAIGMTVEWYKNYSNGCIYDLCVDQINSFLEKRGGG